MEASTGPTGLYPVESTVSPISPSPNSQTKIEQQRKKLTKLEKLDETTEYISRPRKDSLPTELSDQRFNSIYSF